MLKGQATKIGLYLADAVNSSDAVFKSLMPYCKDQDQFVAEYILFKGALGFYSLVQLNLDNDPNYDLLVNIFESGYNDTIGKQGLALNILLYRVKYYFGAGSTREIARLFKEAAGVNADVEQLENVVISMLNSYKTTIRNILSE